MNENPPLKIVLFTKAKDRFTRVIYCRLLSSFALQPQPISASYNNSLECPSLPFPLHPTKDTCDIKLEMYHVYELAPQTSCQV